jgi:hypothetical protein
MAQTLDATLAAAQDSASRRPLLEIMSASFVPEIPFDGQLLTSETTNEQKPNVIAHSSGRLCTIYVFGTRYLKFIYTDTDRTVFTPVTIDAGANHTVIDASLCELTGGNVGIIYLESYSGNYNLRAMVLSPTGEVVSAVSTIGTHPTTDWANAPFVRRLASGTYLLVYAYKTGSTYSIQKKTSSDFATWSASSECVISGLSSTNRRDNPSLVQITTGDVFLWFDYLESTSGTAELTNIYYSVSTDSGSTWGAAVKLTNYTGYDATAIHPIVVQNAAGQMRVVFTEQRGSLKMDDTALGWFTGDNATNITFDPVKRKLYVVNSRPFNASGYKTLENVVKIDVDTWEVDKCWDNTTVPAFDAIFCTGANNVNLYTARGDRHLIPVTLSSNPTQFHIALLDGEADSITMFSFQDWPTYGITKNVNGLSDYGVYGGTAYHVWVDYEAKRLYAVFAFGGPSYALIIGYIDLGQTGPDYNFTEIVHEVTPMASTMFSTMASGSFAVWPDTDRMAISGWSSGGTSKGFLRVYQISTGSLIKHYDVDANVGFPYHGVHDFILQGEKIYGAFGYESLYSQQDRRGLCEIDLLTDTVVYHRPSYATLDNYYLQRFTATEDGQLIITVNAFTFPASTGGVDIYDPADDTWQQFNNSNVPGFTPDGRDSAYSIAYDPSMGTIFTGLTNGVYGWTGVVAFNRYGFIRQSLYIDGTYTTSWAFGASSPLVIGLFDYEAVVVYEPGGMGLYAFWTNQRKEELSVKWDKVVGEFDLDSYLLAGSDIALKRSIDGNTNKLEFSVSHGHLFDPHNTLSLMSFILRKGRKLSVRFGEKVSGVDYWHPAGTFVVTEGSISYKRGEYPKMSIRAEDQRVWWGDLEIVATPHYESFPEDILADVIPNYAGMDVSDIVLPTFDGRYVLWHQWMDTSLKKMVEQICERFGYFPLIDVEDKFRVRRISDANATDHVYSDTTKILEFSPDDSFSDFTNRVVVVGENRDSIEVLAPEERIRDLNGVVGWWGHKKVIRVYYSDDGTSVCRYPRLEITQSVRNFNFKLGGGGESITAVDYYEKWMEITIDTPNLVAIVVSLVAAIVLWGVTWIPVTAPPGIPGIALFELSILLSLLFYVIASIATYSYAVWARPVGRERLHIQGEANDVDFQAELGRVVTKKIDDSLSITQDQCAQVAAQELMVARLQRNLVRFTKTADLRDEEGDTLQLPHPQAGLPMRIFVTDITRKFKKPIAGTGSDGYFLDDIEGWVL